MRFSSAPFKSLRNFFKREVLRDPFLIEIKRWRRDDGDNTLRFDYPLNGESVVWDLGGCKGDFAAEIYRRYNCRIFVFEPMPDFFKECAERFAENSKILCLDFGLSDRQGWFNISDNEDASSFVRDAESTSKAQLRPITEIFNELRLNKIDLLKINIEGGEYDVLPALIDAGLVDRVQHIQVQFHNFIAGAEQKRGEIRTALAKTHLEIWNYPFVWESWALRSAPKSDEGPQVSGAGEAPLRT